MRPTTETQEHREREGGRPYSTGNGKVSWEAATATLIVYLGQRRRTIPIAPLLIHILPRPYRDHSESPTPLPSKYPAAAASAAYLHAHGAEDDRGHIVARVKNVKPALEVEMRDDDEVELM